MGLMRFFGLLFVLVSIFAGSAAVVALVILAVRFWPLMLVIVLTLVLFQFRPKSANKSKR